MLFDRVFRKKLPFDWVFSLQMLFDRVFDTLSNNRNRIINTLSNGKFFNC